MSEVFIPCLVDPRRECHPGCENFEDSKAGLRYALIQAHEKGIPIHSGEDLRDLYVNDPVGASISVAEIVADPYRDYVDDCAHIDEITAGMIIIAGDGEELDPYRGLSPDDMIEHY